MKQVLLSENMRNAWKKVKANNGAPGVDNMSVTDFPQFAQNFWDDMRSKLIDGSYKPLPVRRVEIPKPDGGKRGR